jgi:hypothetical protein
MQSTERGAATQGAPSRKGAIDRWYPSTSLRRVYCQHVRSSRSLGTIYMLGGGAALRLQPTGLAKEGVWTFSEGLQTGTMGGGHFYE